MTSWCTNQMTQHQRYDRMASVGSWSLLVACASRYWLWESASKALSSQRAFEHVSEYQCSHTCHWNSVPPPTLEQPGIRQQLLPCPSNDCYPSTVVVCSTWLTNTSWIATPFKEQQLCHDRPGFITIGGFATKQGYRIWKGDLLRSHLRAVGTLPLLWGERVILVKGFLRRASRVTHLTPLFYMNRSIIFASCSDGVDP